MAAEFGLLRPVAERAVAIVVVVAHGFADIDNRDDDVKEPIIVKVVHDRAACGIQEVQPRRRCDIYEAADIILGFELPRGEKKIGRDTFGILP